MKFLVVDDHPLVRSAMALTLEKVAPGSVALEADTLAAALETLGDTPNLDMIVLDLFMPDSSGLDGISRIKESSQAPVAVLSADEEPQTAIDALARGAAGFLPKSLSEDVMRAAIALILAGGIYVPPQVARCSQGPSPQPRALPLPPTTTRPASGGHSLTPRQREVLDLVIEGLSNREIAQRLSLAEATVKVHITAILRAYGVNSRAKAIGAARRETEAEHRT